MYKHQLVKHSSTLGIIASGVCCFLILVVSTYGDYSIFKYLKYQALAFSLPAVLMFCSVKNTSRNDTYTKPTKVCSLIGMFLLIFNALVLLTNTIFSLNINEDIFGISFIGNVLALVVLVIIFTIISIKKSKYE